MLKHQLTIPQWLDLPIDVRSKLKAIFNIPKSVGSQIVDKVVVSDGHTHADLAVITIEAMQAFLGSKDDDFWTLMESALERVYSLRDQELKKEIEDAQEEKSRLSESKAEALGELARQMEEIAKSAEEIVIKKRGRPKKIV